MFRFLFWHPLKNQILLTSILIFLFGCNIHEPFQPPRYTYELYLKDEASKIDIMKALLECGMEDPIGDLRISNATFKEQLEKHAQAELCMLNSGFSRIPGDKTMCQSIANPDACKAENLSLIPHREIDRRFNSPYCKIYSNARACQ